MESTLAGDQPTDSRRYSTFACAKDRDLYSQSVLAICTRNLYSQSVFSFIVLA